MKISWHDFLHSFQSIDRQAVLGIVIAFVAWRVRQRARRMNNNYSIKKKLYNIIIYWTCKLTRKKNTEIHIFVYNNDHLHDLFIFLLFNNLFCSFSSYIIQSLHIFPLSPTDIVLVWLYNFILSFFLMKRTDTELESIKMRRTWRIYKKYSQYHNKTKLIQSTTNSKSSKRRRRRRKIPAVFMTVSNILWYSTRTHIWMSIISMSICKWGK